MPAPLKAALVRETARRESNVNDVAVGILADEFGIVVQAKRSPPQSASRRKPRPPAPRTAGAEGRDPRRGVAVAAANANDVILAALADGLGVPSVSNRKGKEPMASYERLEERRAREGQGARRDHRRGQLRQLAPAGSRVLQGREAGGRRPRPHARRPRRVPHLGHRVHRRVRRRQGQGRRRPRRRDLGEARTTRSSSPTSRRPASRSRAA